MKERARQSNRYSWLLLLFLGTGMARAAEPEPDPVELPRIAPSEPESALETFQIKPGFRLELVAAEPLVCDPVAMAFDAKGALFVAEMRGYSERRDEKVGRIRRLTDTDGDGKFDSSTIYAQDLAWPTAVTCWKGGILVGASPDIVYLRDVDDDGVADQRDTWFTGFAEGQARLNVQALLNGLSWGLDNRIHGTPAMNGGGVRRFGDDPAEPPLKLNGLDFSFEPRRRTLSIEVGGGQYGLTFDDAGRKYVCSNSNHLQTVLVPQRYHGKSLHYRMPPSRLGIAVDGPAAEVFRISPDEPWRKVRTRWRVGGKVKGPVEGGGRVSGYFTAATGICIYRGAAFPSEYSNNAFVCDAGSNLVHRKLINTRDGRVEPYAERPGDERRTEFLASSDNWFRPVQLANGPDGALYIADMYREVIEHPWSIPESIKKHLDLNSGNDRGRIYRIVPEGFEQPKRALLATMTTLELIGRLDSTNGWQRETAARLLYERDSRRDVDALRQLVKEGTTSQGRMAALWVLKGLTELEESDLVGAFKDSSSLVRQQAIRLSEQVGKPNGLLIAEMAKLAADPEPKVRFQLALSLIYRSGPEKKEALRILMKRDAADPWMRSAILSAMEDSPTGLLIELLSDETSSWELLAELAGLIAKTGKVEGKQAVIDAVKETKKDGLKFTLVKALADASITIDRDLLEQALAVAQRPELAEATRLPAIRLLAFSDSDEVVPTLGGFLQPEHPVIVQKAAMETLGEVHRASVGKVLCAAWSALSPAMQSKAIQQLFARQERLTHLVEALEDKRISVPTLTPTQVAILRNHKDASIKARAERIFESLGDSAKARAEVLQSFQPALDLSGSAKAGLEVFKGRCAICHRSKDGSGNAVGPEVASFAASGKATILSHVIDPNSEFQAVHTAYLVETKDGTTWHGSISEEDASSLTLVLPLGVRKVLQRDEVKEIKNLGMSLMPEGLEAGLSHQSMADLLAYLVGDGPASESSAD